MPGLARILFALLCASFTQSSAAPQQWSGLREVNPPAPPPNDQVVAILGATLLDGLGGPPLPDSAVVVRGGEIVAAGTRGSVYVPEDAERVDATGLWLLPGMLDGHFHTSDPKRITGLLRGGFTSFRDPGRPLEAYEKMLASPGPMPRAFLTGPHFDQKPHAHPHNAVHLENEGAVNQLIDRLHGDGASAIKIYYRLPLDLIRASCERADRHGIPVTAHLELVRADAAIRAGLDGIEHVTSLGTSLASEEDARAFEAGVEADNAFRDDGRYWLWSRVQLDDNPKVEALLDLMLEHGVYLTPTLRPFAVEPGSRGVTEEKLAGFKKMQQFTKIAQRAGVPIVASSHGPTPEAAWRELELLVDSGLSPAETLATAMMIPARFLGVAERLGSIEPGKAADLTLLEENPLQNISAVRKVSRVMLAGEWVK